MYSRLNVIVKDINALEISKIDSGSINRKILMLLPKPKYNIINAMLQKENLDTMEVGELVAKFALMKWVSLVCPKSQLQANQLL